MQNSNDLYEESKNDFSLMCRVLLGSLLDSDKTLELVDYWWNKDAYHSGKACIDRESSGQS